VYVLANEFGINAFAAGFSPRDAVIGVTRGTIDNLRRDELQGVIAHEFSHIFNGDMRLNIRLIGILNGIVVLGMIGYYLLRATPRAGHRFSRGAIPALGLGLMVIGYAGVFFGNLIKSAVSRQREYLADASAVQFTRDPDGIAGALKKIGGLYQGSQIDNPGAPEISHTFFAQGVSGFMQSLFATHPPLTERIRRVDPRWDGRFAPLIPFALIPDDAERSAEGTARERMSASIGAALADAALPGAALHGASAAEVLGAIDTMGNPSPQALAQARALIAELPASIKDAAHEPYGARAVVYLLLLDRAQQLRARQLQRLGEHADPGVYALLQRLLADIGALHVKHRLPLLDIAMPALKQLSAAQYGVFRHNVLALIEVDATVNLLEWSLQKILLGHLDGHFGPRRDARTATGELAASTRELALFLSLLAHAGHQSEADAERGFAAAARGLGVGALQLCAKNTIRLRALDDALTRLARLRPLAKYRLLKACVAGIVVDQHIAPVEVELLRAFSCMLDCPMPHLYGGYAS
jgi:hypothetical protein